MFKKANGCWYTGPITIVYSFYTSDSTCSVYFFHNFWDWAFVAKKKLVSLCLSIVLLCCSTAYRGEYGIETRLLFFSKSLPRSPIPSPTLFFFCSPAATNFIFCLKLVTYLPLYENSRNEKSHFKNLTPSIPLREISRVISPCLQSGGKSLTLLVRNMRKKMSINKTCLGSIKKVQIDSLAFLWMEVWGGDSRGRGRGAVL